jgi:DNA-binding NtrC family response regulator
VFKLIGAFPLRCRGDVTARSGCGKGSSRASLQKFSPRAQKEFVGINVTAIPDNLLERNLRPRKGAPSPARSRSARAASSSAMAHALPR